MLNQLSIKFSLNYFDAFLVLFFTILLFLFVFLFMRNEAPEVRSPGCAFIGSL